MSNKDLKNIDLNQTPDMDEAAKQRFYIEKCKEWLTKQSEKLGRPLTACTVTFGCQMNARDSEKIIGTLEEIGFVATESENADFVIYNTCTVRENANQRVYGRLGHLNSLKKKNPNMMIALCGCMMQEDTVVDKIKQSYRFVDIIFGTHNIFKLAEYIYTRTKSKGMVIDIWKGTDRIVENLPSDRKYSFKAGVNIMYGCNNYCSYCIVPYVRGRERSRNPEDIIKEIKDLVADGVVEVMLLGQNVNSYGKTLETPMTFAGLLKEVEKVEGLERIRFMTPHPKDLSEELIEVMSKSTKICKQVHLPLQSGSTEILRKMNRHYTKEQYLDLVERIKAAVPDVALSTDIIVGFPGETEEDFLETMDVVRKVKFHNAFTFIYSKRTGTPAAVMENQIEEPVAKERFNRLITAVKEEANSVTSGMENTIQKVLVEEMNEQDSSLMTGRLSNNLLVHFKSGRDLIGQIVDVKLTECKGFYYLGELV